MLPYLMWAISEYDNVSSEIQPNEQADDQHQNWNNLSIGYNLLLPITGLALFFGKSLLTRFWLQFDRHCVPVFCPSFSKTEKLLKWAVTRLPLTLPSKTFPGGVADLWSDGSLLCTLINSAIPGACPNPHRHWKKPPHHAQAIAYKYLGLIPIFTEDDLNGPFTANLERNFLRYLTDLQSSINKLSEKNEVNKVYSTQYVPRGMGLFTGEQHRKTVFYVYTIGKGTDGVGGSSVIIQIRGPYGTFGKAVIPNIQNNLFSTPKIRVSSSLDSKVRNSTNKNAPNRRNSFVKSFSLSFMQYHKKHMGDNVVIDVFIEEDRARITYIPKNYGIYEINMIANGELVSGCPFHVHILNNTSGIEETFDNLDSAEEIPTFKKRKVISKTIDFVSEQLPVADFLKKYKTNKKEVKENISGNKIQVTSAIISKNILEATFKDNSDLTEIKNSSFESNKKKDIKKDGFKLSQNVLVQNEKIDEENEDDIQKEITTDLEKQISISQCITENKIDKLKTAKKGFITMSDGTCEESFNVWIKDANSKCNGHESTLVPSKIKTIKNEVFEGDKNKYGLNGHNSEPLNSQTQNIDNNIIATKSYKNQEKYNTAHIKNFDETTIVSQIHIPSNFKTIEKKINGEFDLYVNKTGIYNLNRTEPVKEQKILNVKEFLTENVKLSDGATKNVKELKNKFLNETLAKAISRRNSLEDVQQAKKVSSRFFQASTQNSDFPKPKDLSPSSKIITSPICPDHIDPEVEIGYRNMLLAEKRKFFVKQPPINTSDSMCSSLSDCESLDQFKIKNQYHFEGLSVLNVLDSLKQQNCVGDSEYNSLGSTVSLPNMSSVDSKSNYQNNVKSKKDFWEKISSRSSSCVSLYSEISPKRKIIKLSDEGRSKLLWKKPDESKMCTTGLYLNIQEQVSKESDLHKSADDILSITDYIPHQNLKKYKSMDTSLDTCSVLTIEERKKMLLKQLYEKEKVEREKLASLKKKCFSIGGSIKENQMNEIRIKCIFNKNDNISFAPVKEKIEKYHSVFNLAQPKEKETKIFNTKSNLSRSTNDIPKNFIHNDLQDLAPAQKNTMKSHFRRAIKYFKSLEEKSLGKSNPKTKNTIKMKSRKLSLDLKKIKNTYNKKGGSLNLPNVSQRFSISNLYDDIFGSKGSFRGTPNKSAVVEALSTFSRNNNNNNNMNNCCESNLNLEDEDIKFDIFKIKAKSKQRTSLKSIFDVYY